MKGLRLYKKEKLCSTVAIERLFTRDGQSHAALEYPLRAVWRENPGRRSDAPLAFVVSVPKRRLRHAVDRVAMRRRIREAYRLMRPGYPMPAGTRVDVAFIYLADGLLPYSRVEGAMRRIMAKIQASLAPAEAAGDEQS